MAEQNCNSVERLTDWDFVIICFTLLFFFCVPHRMSVLALVVEILVTPYNNVQLVHVLA